MEQMQMVKKITKIKVLYSTTEEQVIEQLQNINQASEFRLALTLNPQLEIYLKRIVDFLKKQQNLQKLQIFLSFETYLSLERTLFQLKDLITISDLTLSFFNVSFSFKEKVTLSQCFSQYTNLESFSIQLDCKFLSGKENLVRFYEVFQKNPNIRKLEITLSFISDHSSLPQAILEGIKFLSKLEVFNFNVSSSKFACFSIIDCLEEELKDKMDLKHIKFYFGQNSLVSQSDFQKIGRLLKTLINLEKLELFVSHLKNGLPNFQEIGLEESIYLLQNLKVLIIDLQEGIKKSVRKIVDSISQMKQLEQVNLAFYVEKNTLQGDTLINFGESIAKISSLSSLRISFQYSYQVELDELITFICNLSKLEKLKELDITSYKQQSIRPLNYDKEIFAKIISRLNIFRFILYATYKQQSFENDIVRAINEAVEFESLTYEIYYPNHMKKNESEDNQLALSLFKNKNILKQISVFIPNNQDFINNLSQNFGLERIKFKFIDQLDDQVSLFQSLSGYLVRLEKLSDLNLEFGTDSFHLDDISFNIFAVALKQLKSLQSLKIRFSKDLLQLETINNFTSSFQNLKKLKKIYLEISGRAFRDDKEETQFAQHFTFPLKLHIISLTFIIKKLKFKNLEQIFKKISDQTKLVFLDIRFLRIQMDLSDCMKLRTYLQNQEQLKTINIPFCSMSQLYLVSLFSFLKSLQIITFFYTSYSYFGNILVKRKISYLNETQENKIIDEQRIEKISLTVNNEQLFDEDEFDNCEAHETILKPIFDSLICLTKFKFHINNKSRLSQELIKDIFLSIQNLQNLEYFNIQIEGNNQVGTENINTLGKVLLSLPKLKKLYLSIYSYQNSIEWLSCTEFVSNIGIMCQLTHFEIEFAFIKSTVVEKENEYQTIFAHLCQSLQRLTNLSHLKIEVTNLLMNENCIEELKDTLKSLRFSLKSLSLLFGEGSLLDPCLLMRGIASLQQLHQLQINNLSSNNLKKLKRLVAIQDSK